MVLNGIGQGLIKSGLFVGESNGRISVTAVWLVWAGQANVDQVDVESLIP